MGLGQRPQLLHPSRRLPQQLCLRPCRQPCVLSVCLGHGQACTPAREAALLDTAQ